MGTLQDVRTFLSLFVHRRTEVAHPESTKVFLKLGPEMAMHSPTSPIPPFRLMQNLYCFQRTLQVVSSEDESFIPDVSSYIQESVKHPYLVLTHLSLWSFF